MAGQIDSYDLESDELVTLPFAMVDTLFLSLELESVRRSTVEFTKLLSRRFRR